MVAAMAAKDAQIAELTRTLARPQQTIETMMAAMAANGTIPTQVAATELVDLQVVSAGSTAAQASPQQGQDGSMWAGAAELASQQELATSDEL